MNDHFSSVFTVDNGNCTDFASRTASTLTDVTFTAELVYKRLCTCTRISRTFQDLEIVPQKIHDFPGLSRSVGTLCRTSFTTH